MELFIKNNNDTNNPKQRVEQHTAPAALTLSNTFHFFKKEQRNILNIIKLCEIRLYRNVWFLCRSFPEPKLE